MTRDGLRQRELLLIEILQAGLDMRDKAASAEAPMLVYLADLLAKRAREELVKTGARGDAAEELATEA